ncbi:Glutaredoxin [Acididesulfobacillus acetoxydans]|uniref:Glutaredoxin n=1 Tax=Acididesulfobacillus acetoxydans TaxID=1561005 RepID=A0A8S0WZ48_9FIRM|nr:glutaredoxin domain-containing protein [Acididesulfobacillus acetoxydans]CAA7601801.1 Glutaredoxin [Acididesulfobacillus acetoxydans]CEJ09221.1 Glutaredoxin [Acididesulfobacillus acetoxydans]
MAVTVYSTPTCSFCTAAKRYLKERNIPFRDVDISRDAKAAADMVRKTGQQGVPVIDINGKIIVGFDKPKINSALGLRG